ncbi:MAG TPA: pilus assembly PilX N-terminal domain-containing protein [Methylomirabilota bacterium]|nr:pilus assembly PilX N-terminal domain-containing protein [Methylomirabilota bacterium]
MPAPRSTLERHVLDERGSVLLMSIVLVFVMTLLGLALFDLGAIENRMSLASQADLRAFEVAQAGIERALRELQDGFVGDAAGSESWADNDGVRAPICSPSCATGVYRPMTLANTTFPGGGSFAVEIMLITVPEANATSPYPIGLNCFRNAANVCTNLVFVRSTGTVTDSPAGGATSPAPAGYTARKTLQVVARAYAPSVLANGLVAGTPSAQQPVNGNVLIAGSAHVLGSPVGALPAIDWNGAGTGFVNHLGTLAPAAPAPDAEILRRLPPQQAVCTPTATPCAAPNVYSLGADVQIARPTATAAITLAGGAVIGGAAGAAYATGGSGPGSLAGKGPLDAIYVADGCQNSTCSDSYAVTSPSQLPVVDLGAIGRAYPENPVAPFPLLTGANPVAIGAGTYANLQTYFSTRAADLSGNLNTAGRPGHSGGLFANTANWNTPNPPSGGNFTNKNGAARRGRICWNRANGVLTFGITGTGTTTNPCNTPATAADPLLVYNTNAAGWRITRNAFAGRSSAQCAGTTQICYNGAAVIYNVNSVMLEEAVTSACLTGSNPTCTGEKFPTNELMVLLTPGNVTVSVTTTSVPRVMAMLYAGTDFIARSSPGGTITRIVGGVAASRFCFGGGGTCPGGPSNHPEVIQAPLSGASASLSPVGDSRSLPEEVLALSPSINGQAPRHWRVESVPRLWLECRPSSGALPTTPTGVCSY